MIIASLQPAYLPWLGFFEQVHRADLFVLYDEIPYHARDWRNRNFIKTSQGKLRLTVPVVHQSGQRIKDVRIDPNDNHWRRQHWKAIVSAYSRAPFFDDHAGFFESVYAREWNWLVDLDFEIIQYLCRAFEIETPVRTSSELGLEKLFVEEGIDENAKTRRIVSMMKNLGGTLFYEGQAGRDYIDIPFLNENGIEVEFQNYRHQEYAQLFGDFIPYLSAIDLLFNKGPESLPILLGNRKPGRQSKSNSTLCAS